MYKGFFFSLPSISVANTLSPIIEEMALHNFHITCYNTEAFRLKESSNLHFKAYMHYNDMYSSDNIGEDISYFQFGEMLIDAAGGLLDFLIDEVEKEKPDFILHSHLAPWGKLIASYFKLPAISLCTTIFLEEKITVPFIKELNNGRATQLSNINNGKRLYNKMQLLHDKLGIPDKVNIWDVYVNKEKLNLSFVMKEFQPRIEMLSSGYHFLGSPNKITDHNIQHDVIYVSLGTIFNDDISFYKLCIQALRHLKLKCILSVGRKIEIEELGEIPANIKIERFSNQTNLLRSAAVFITRGGMASVHEAISTLTPMIVIPAIPEQIITAERIKELGIGIRINRSFLTEETLLKNVNCILSKKEFFISNLRKLKLTATSTGTPLHAYNLVHDYLREELVEEGS